jgi:hypothetical protein
VRPTLVRLLLLAAASTGLHAQEAAPPERPAPAPPVEHGDAEEAEERPTGLPGKGGWTFHLDAAFGAFGFANSLYADVRPDPSGDLSDNWLESYVKPGLEASFRVGRSELLGALSAVGERTFAAPPPRVGREASSFQVEDLHLRWRSGTAIASSEDLLELTFGRARYELGHGLLLWDGAGEGGSRGGYWSNARKAWELAAIARVRPGRHTLEAFYLDRDELPEAETGTRLFGLNYELALGDSSTLGASWLRFTADPAVLPERDGMDVLDLRAFVAPIRGLPGLALELEYAREQNGELLRSDAWIAQLGHEWRGARWKPRLSYRYASFGGDDPQTTRAEGFDPLLPGFHDWGTWWQGEIAGEYFLANSNLVSHQARLHLSPSESVGAGLIAYLFRLQQPAALDPLVSSKDVAFELDAYCDWELHDAWTLSVVAAFAEPGTAVEQAFGRTRTFVYGMAYLSYSY